jgi:outer membrane receptor protein involved in Fe transport
MQGQTSSAVSRPGDAASSRWPAVLTIAAALAMPGGPVAAQESRPERAASQQLAQAEARHDFSIAPQPLRSALVEFGSQSGLQVSYPSELAGNLRSPGVSGQLTPTVALQRLLAGTGLSHRFTGPTTVTLEKAPAGEPGVVRLDEVVVTGEKYERSLRDTAASVMVFDQGALEARPSVTSANSLLERVPNITSTGTNNLAPAVRGIDGTGPSQGVDAFFGGVRPRLNVQVDGRPTSYNEVVFGDVSLWDVERVEVFRGPQSTLQGRNSIAGSMVIKTKDPTYEPEISVRGIMGNERNRQMSAAVSGPIIDNQLAARFAFDRQTSESFIKFTPFANVAEPGEFESQTLRGKLLIEPKAWEGFSTLLTLNHSEHTAPQVEFVNEPTEDHVPTTPQMPVFNPRATSGIIDTNWTFGDYSIENKLALTDFGVKRLAPAGDGNVKINGTEVLEEPRFLFSGLDGRLKGVGGLYYFRASQDEFIDTFGGGNFEDKTTTAAAYGEATLTVLGDFDLTAGGRMERENRQRRGVNGPLAVDFDETYKVFLPKAGVAWHATEDLTVGTTVARGYNGGGAGITFFAPFVDYTYEPEYVWNYEAYVRADLLGGRLNLTGNIFYADYKDMQLPFNLGAGSVVIRNADKAVSYGAEFGAKWRALPELQLFAELGLLQTEIKKYPNSGVEGNELPRAPNFSFDVGALYTHSSGIEVGADVRYSDSYFSDVNNRPRGNVDPYWVANAQVGYTVGAARVFGFVNNVFDSGDPVLFDFIGATPAEDSIGILRPRTFGVGLQMTF